MITAYVLPIMGGGAIPMAQVYSDVTGKSQASYLSFALAILALGNIIGHPSGVMTMCPELVKENAGCDQEPFSPLFFLGMISWGEAILRMAVSKSIIKPTKKTKIFVGRFTLWENH